MILILKLLTQLVVLIIILIILNFINQLVYLEKSVVIVNHIVIKFLTIFLKYHYNNIKLMYLPKQYTSFG